MKPKTKVRLSLLLLDVLDLVEDDGFLATRPNLDRLSRYWGYTQWREAQRALERWRLQQYLEKIKRGNQVLYRLGKPGQEFLALHRPAPAARRRAWDGRWRMVVFDFPEVARRARDAFRRELVWQRMGCLQKSVWITPNPVNELHREVRAARG